MLFGKLWKDFLMDKSIYKDPLEMSDTEQGDIALETSRSSPSGAQE